MRGLRVASVFVPSLIAVVVAINTSASQVHGAGLVLAGMWILMACALWMRYRQAREVDVSLDNRLSWQQLDVLSATGRATVWTAVLALALASKTG